MKVRSLLLGTILGAALVLTYFLWIKAPSRPTLTNVWGDTLPTGVDSIKQEGVYLLTGDKIAYVDTLPTRMDSIKKGKVYLWYGDKFTYFGADPDPDPVPYETVLSDHEAYKADNNGKTEWVNFKVADILDYAIDANKAAEKRKVTIDSFRIKFIQYQHAPTIRGVTRRDYVGKISVALIALSGDKEFTYDSAGLDARPRNLGTIRPPDR